MLSVAQNERFTQTSKGTPMGELLRRYWHPVAGSSELSEENPTKDIRLLSEDLVLFRSTKGVVGLIEPSCPHRKASLSYGVPEPEGIRCAYHGWVFDETGACLDQPSEPAGSRFKDKVKIKAYPVEELGGVVWAYLGPAPAPVLPRWDILTWDNVERFIISMELPCNWLQCMDNSLDPVHFEWLHNYWGSYVMGMEKPAEERAEWKERMQSENARGRHEVKVGFDRFQYGIIKRRLLEGDTEDNQWWRIGHPVLFPNTLRVGQGRNFSFQIRVPMDDTHTHHFVYRVQVPEEGVVLPPQGPVRVDFESVYKPDGRVRADWVLGQDQAAWIIQGPITDRTDEHLGATDVGIILYRRLINEQLKTVEDGGDPINVHRTDTGPIYLQQEHSYYPGYTETGGPFRDMPIHAPDVEMELAAKISADFA